MNERNNRPKLSSIGFKLTKLYLIVLFGGIPVLAFFGAIELKQIGLNELGDFLAGAFGPLAIFWVVLGFLQQGEELRNSVAVLTKQSQEMETATKHHFEISQATAETLQENREQSVRLTRMEISTSLRRLNEASYETKNLSQTIGIFRELLDTDESPIAIIHNSFDDEFIKGLADRHDATEKQIDKLIETVGVCPPMNFLEWPHRR